MATKQKCALIVDDDPGIVRIVEGVLASLGHTYHTADCQEAARGLLAKHIFDYVLLDLEIPVHSGREFSRTQNGINLLEEIAQDGAHAGTPAIVMTAHGTSSPDLCSEVYNKGAANWINKPFPSAGRTLDVVIKETLDRAARLVMSTAVKSSTERLGDPLARAIIDFHQDRVELCGVRISGARNSTQERKILELLAEKNSHGRFLPKSCEDLASQAGSGGGQNSISGTVKNLRRKISSVVEKELGVRCENTEIIESTKSQGYRFANKVEVRLHGNGGLGNSGKPNFRGGQLPGRSAPDRISWIRDRLLRGEKLKASEVARELGVSSKTVERYFDSLKQEGVAAYQGSSRSGFFVFLERGGQVAQGK